LFLEQRKMKKTREKVSNFKDTLAKTGGQIVEERGGCLKAGIRANIETNETIEKRYYCPANQRDCFTTLHRT